MDANYDDKASNKSFLNNISNFLPDTKIKTIILIVSLILIIIFLFLIFNNKSNFHRIENEMIEQAKAYVINNNIVTDNEIYINSSKMDYQLNDNCKRESGVLFNGTEYQAYLLCNNYESEIVNNNNNNITLNGKSFIVIPKGITYLDEGYNSKLDITVMNNLQDEEGVYNIYYVDENSEESITRKVVIIDDSVLYALYPKLSLIGNREISIKIGSNYLDDGVNVTDNFDDDINNKLITVNTVDTNNIGKYQVKYSVTNSKGYTASLKRDVSVLENVVTMDIRYIINPRELTSDKVTITLSVIGNDFDYIDLPNNEKNSTNYLQYEISENGIYNFTAHDKNNNIVSKSITIDNISKDTLNGICKATWYSQYTNIDVLLNTTKNISHYEYIINDKKEVTKINKNYQSSTIKPNNVEVIIKDDIGNDNTIKCSIEDKSDPQVYVDSSGRNCIEGYKCYLQYDYGNSSKYPYCSMSDNPNSCGGIGRNGCSITAATIAISGFGLKSKNGEIYNPYTVWEELYPVNKSTGQCNAGCSAWSRIKNAITNAGLSATSILKMSSDRSMLIEHLKKGYPAVAWAGTGPYARNKGHYMAIIAIRSDGFVFLSSSSHPFSKGDDQTLAGKDNGKQYYVNTWVSLDDLSKGNVPYFILVGPANMYN